LVATSLGLNYYLIDHQLCPTSDSQLQLKYSQRSGAFFALDHNVSMTDIDAEAVEAEIADLETKLSTAKKRLNNLQVRPHPPGYPPPPDLPSSSQHSLLLLSDSALPLGSFAYSSGLESYIAHHKPLPHHICPSSSFDRFLRLSVESVAFTNVPYVLASFRQPGQLNELDNDLDASTPCTVARRASVAQGRALLGIWEKALQQSITSSGTAASIAGERINSFGRTLKLSALSTKDIADVNGHFAPLWGAVCLALGLEIQQVAYLFLFNHAKMVLSAAVRAGVMGPYQAQSILAGPHLQTQIRSCLKNVWNVHPEDAGQAVPVMDLWVGRHELLYSRIFNS
jgi:urease accessory protein